MALCHLIILPKHKLDEPENFGAIKLLGFGKMSQRKVRTIVGFGLATRQTTAMESFDLMKFSSERTEFPGRFTMVQFRMVCAYFIIAQGEIPQDVLTRDTFGLEPKRTTRKT
jgi:hypothetical protein